MLQRNCKVGWLCSPDALLAVLPFLALLTYLALSTRLLFDESVGYPDADRLLMDGLFLADFLRELPFAGPLRFALGYFAQYPALSLGYKPPFFPLSEAPFFLVFGEHVWAGRLAVIVYGVFGGFAYYILVREMYGRAVAGTSALLLASLPYIAWWSWYTMTEVPVLALMLVTGLLTWRLSETGRVSC